MYICWQASVKSFYFGGNRGMEILHQTSSTVWALLSKKLSTTFANWFYHLSFLQPWLKFSFGLFIVSVSCSESWMISLLPFLWYMDLNSFLKSDDYFDLYFWCRRSLDKNCRRRGLERCLRLRVLTALPEDSGSIPSTHKDVWNSIIWHPGDGGRERENIVLE